MADQTLRLAIVSSPRSGNSWVRMVLAGALELQQIAVHNFLDAPDALPARCLLQIHWYREPNFQVWLRAHEFQVITIARHPLDVLVSALRFVSHEPETAKWLLGNAELPGGLAGTAPSSPEFLRYALGFGAENLLLITYQWWHDADAIRLRYEDVVADPGGSLGALAQRFGDRPDLLQAALAAVSLKSMRELPNRHGWQGTPGLWRRLIPPVDAWRIYRRHAGIFRRLDYKVRPYALTRRAALRNWRELA